MRRRLPARFSAVALLNLLCGGSYQPVEVELRGGLGPGGVGQVEVERGDRDRALAHRGEVRALLLVEACVLAVDPVALAAPLLLGQLQAVVVDALPEAAGPGAGGLLPWDVHVE